MRHAKLAIQTLLAATCAAGLSIAQADALTQDRPPAFAEAAPAGWLASAVVNSSDARAWAQAFGQVTLIEAVAAPVAARLAMPRPGGDAPVAQPAGGYRVTVRMDSGATISVTQPSIGSLVNGSRVKLVGGAVTAV